MYLDLLVCVDVSIFNWRSPAELALPRLAHHIYEPELSIQRQRRPFSMHRPISGCELEEPNHFSFPLPSDPEHRHGNVSPQIRLGLSLDYLITGIGPTIHVYALPDFRHIHSLACEDGTLIQALEIHNDILVTASENVLVPNDTIRVWDLVSGTCLCSVPHPEHDVDEFFVMSIYKPETEVSAAEEHGRESSSKMAMYRLHDPILSIWALADSSYEAAKIIEQVRYLVFDTCTLTISPTGC